MIQSHLFLSKTVWRLVVASFILFSSLYAGTAFKTEYEKCFGQGAYRTPYQEADKRDMPCFMAMVADLAYKIEAVMPQRLIIFTIEAGGISAFMRDIIPNTPFPFLIVGSYIFKEYTDEQITAIIAHELAHIKNGDADRLDKFRRAGFLATAAVVGGCIMTNPLHYASYITAAACGVGGWLMSLAAEAYVARMAEKRADLTAVEVLDDHRPWVEVLKKLSPDDEILGFAHHPSPYERVQYVVAAAEDKKGKII